MMNKEAGPGSAPNYGPAMDPAERCSKCSHAQSGYCTLYDFDFDSSYTCDSFSADITAQTSEGVPQVLEKYLPKTAQYVNPYLADLEMAHLNKPLPKSLTELVAWLIDRHDYKSKLTAYHGALDEMKEAQVQPQANAAPQGLQQSVTQPTGATTNINPNPGAAASTEQLNSDFKNIAQQGIQNGAAVASGVKPGGDPRDMSNPYGVNSNNVPYGVNAMDPSMLMEQQGQPQQPKMAQAIPANQPYAANPIRMIPDQQGQYNMPKYQDRVHNSRMALQQAARQRYQILDHQARQQQAMQTMAMQQRKAQLEQYAAEQAKQASYSVGFANKCSELGVDPALLLASFDKEAKQTESQKNKISTVMKEYKSGKLRSGSKKGPKVKDRKQAIAIALSEAGVNKKSK